MAKRSSSACVAAGVLGVVLAAWPVGAHPGHEDADEVAQAQPMPPGGPGAGPQGRRSGNQAGIQRGGQRNIQQRQATPQVQIIEKDGYRYITSNGIPDHATGAFPNRGNPNTIGPQQYRFRVTMNPTQNVRPTPSQPHNFGVALNGVPFDPGTAEFWSNNPRSGWNYDALSGKINLGLDQNNAHVQPTGAYHYHGLPTGLINDRGGRDAIILVGYAADGFPIYGPTGYSDPKDPNSPLKTLTSSYQLKPGTRNGGPGGTHDGTFVQDWQYVEGAGDLDECNGRFGMTPEYPDGTYHYVLTEAFPFVPRLWRGTPDSSFMKQGPGRGGSGGRMGPNNQMGPGGPGGPGGQNGMGPRRRRPGPPPNNGANGQPPPPPMMGGGF